MGLLTMGHGNQITSLTTTQAELLIELRYICFTTWGYGISDYYSYNADKN